MSLMHRVVFNMLMKTRTLYKPGEKKDYEAVRRGEIASASYVKTPRSVSIRRETLNSVPADWIISSKNPSDQIILYIHGGGFVTGSSEARKGFTTYVVDKLGFNLVSVDYRLAPEYPFPAGPEDCLEAYHALLELYPAEKIVLMGESAGGNLVLSLLVQIKQNGMPYPAASFVIAPTVQYDRELSSYKDNLATDCIVTNLTDEVCDVYLCSQDKELLKNPVAAPLYGDYEGCTPVIIWASNTEVLYDDSMLMFEKFKAQGVTTKLYLRSNMMHTWLIVPLFSESRKDLQKIGHDLRLAFDGALDTMGDPIQLG